MQNRKQHEQAFVDFIKKLAAQKDRWHNVLFRDSFCYPVELLKDNKVCRYLHPFKNTDQKFIKPVVDVIFTRLPENFGGDIEYEYRLIFDYIKTHLMPNGFHVRPFRFMDDKTVRGYVFRVFYNSDFPCTIHPEYITHAEGRSPCPICKTAVTFGEFHPLEIKPCDSRLVEITS